MFLGQEAGVVHAGVVDLYAVLSPEGDLFDDQGRAVPLPCFRLLDRHSQPGREGTRCRANGTCCRIDQFLVISVPGRKCRSHLRRMARYMNLAMLQHDFRKQQPAIQSADMPGVGIELRVCCRNRERAREHGRAKYEPAE